VILRILADVDRVERRAAVVARERHGARQGAPAELDAGHGRARTESGQRLEHRLADQHVAFGSENGLLAVDEEVALAARGEDHALALERALAE
jgi:hypothetical protein